MRTSAYLTLAAFSLCVAAPALAQSSGFQRFEFGPTDADGNGAVSTDELVAAFSEVFPSRAAAVHLIASKDEDGDGELDASEFENSAPVPPIILSPEIAIMAPFEEVDLDRDGLVTVAELDAKGSGPFMSLHKLYVAGADKDGNGALSNAEWSAERPTMTMTVSAGREP